MSIKKPFTELKRRNKKLVLSSWDQGLSITKGMPLRFTLNTSYKCNLRCIMCQFHRTPKVSKRVVGREPKLKSDIYLSFLDDIFPTLIEAETTTVGEPFLSKHINLTVDKAREYDVKLYITTNGILLNKRNIEKVYNLMSTLVISIDGATKNVYERIRKKSNYNQLLANIEKFNEIRNSMDYKPKLTLQMTLLKDNIHELPLLVKLAHRVGADNVKAYHAYIYDVHFEEQSLFNFKEKFNNYRNQALNLAARLKITTFLPNEFGDSLIKLQSTSPLKFDKPPCRFLWSEGFLEPTGDLTACFFPYKFNIGNISNEKFIDIWNNGLYQDLRTKVSLPNPRNYCTNCVLRFTYIKGYDGAGISKQQFILSSDERLDFFR